MYYYGSGTDLDPKHKKCGAHTFTVLGEPTRLPEMRNPLKLIYDIYIEHM